jgi:hypothetical protein
MAYVFRPVHRGDEPRRFQRLHRFSRSSNIYNKPGNLLSHKLQIPRMEEMGLGHKFWHSGKAGAESKS